MTNSLQLQLTGQGDSVKLSWTTPQYSRLYCVNRDRLRSASQEVRDVLQNIALEYVSKNATYEQFLPALANAGESLKEALFSPVDEDTSVENLLSYLDSQPRGTPLTVC